GDVAARVRRLDRLALDHLGLFGLHVLRPRHLDRQLLDRVVRQVPEHLRRALGAERDQQDRRLAPARDLSAYCFIHWFTWSATCSGDDLAISSSSSRSWLRCSAAGSSSWRAAGRWAWGPASSWAIGTTDSNSRSHVGSGATPSCSRRLRPRRTKKRKRSAAIPTPTSLARPIGLPSAASGPPVFAVAPVAAGLANFIVVTLRVSPRVASIPAAAVTALLTAVTSFSGTESSTMSATSRRLTAPGAIGVRPIVLRTAEAV